MNHPANKTSLCITEEIQSTSTITILACEYDEAARKLRKWIKENEDSSDDYMERRKMAVAKQALRDISSISKYLKNYYGNRSNCQYYHESLITVYGGSDE